MGMMPTPKPLVKGYEDIVVGYQSQHFKHRLLAGGWKEEDVALAEVQVLAGGCEEEDECRTPARRGPVHQCGTPARGGGGAGRRWRGEWAVQDAGVVMRERATPDATTGRGRGRTQAQEGDAGRCGDAGGGDPDEGETPARGCGRGRHRKPAWGCGTPAQGGAVRAVLGIGERGEGQCGPR
ncbi:hypothetical protein ABZP36_011100 [Zizania latifolia]